jgi:hypothetical protein
MSLEDRGASLSRPYFSDAALVRSSQHDVLIDDKMESPGQS